MSVEIIKKATPPVEITGALTDTELRAADVPVTLDSEVVAVSGPLTDTELRLTAVPVAQALPEALFYGVQAVATAGTAEPLAATSTPLSAGLVRIRALAGNSGIVYVGDSDVDAATGYPLAGGEEMLLNIGDLADVYVDAAVNDDGVKFVAS